MSHSPNPGWQPNNHWNVCMVCGFDVRAKESKRTWDHRVVCKDCWEPRHPLDLIRAIPDNSAPVGLSTGNPIDIGIISTDEGADDPNRVIPSGTFGDYSS